MLTRGLLCLVCGLVATGGVAVAWPAVELTAWGAAESKRLTTPETPDPCMPHRPKPAA